MSEWISVDERLPKDSGEYLVFCKKGYMMVAQYSKHYKKFNTNDDITAESAEKYAFKNVTHWMPLPEPPNL